ncbi:hypothetical protein QJS10_CPA03g00790 [Acorus calamus]|uniref:Reverse transcriptase zinc-binding domain-containing protein n=1 Tax=Acorus calamus TaxID=4465 RepID=A0AAV9F687_ACOCL|nr:hypothetical protein QJS10_CPA03g00790 [Acorus calamus]
MLPSKSQCQSQVDHASSYVLPAETTLSDGPTHPMKQPSSEDEIFPPPYLFDSPRLASEMRLPNIDTPLEIVLSSTAPETLVASQATRVKKGSGKRDTINIWTDPWLHGFGLQHYLQGSTLLCWGPPREVLLNTLIQDGKWHKPHRWPSENDELWNDIAELEVGGGGRDILVWTGSKTGKISCSSAWENIRKKRPSTPWTRALWNPIQPPRRSFLCWQAALDRLPTLQRLFSRQLVQNNTCSLCSSGLESTSDTLAFTRIRPEQFNDEFLEH